MKKTPFISIIIPLHVIEPRFFNDLKKFSLLNYSAYEIIVVSDSDIHQKISNIRFLKTGKEKTGPAEKRDVAIKHAKGEICAFIDDDAYPDPEWLKNSIFDFQNKEVGAVGGPGLTPREDGFLSQVTGAVYESYLCGGHAQHRFIKSHKRFVKDYPAYNLLVRTVALKEVGGYGSYFYGGEDTFLCLKLIRKHWKILYDPDVVVYHHRRPMLLPYLKQIANVGMHRGYFAKVFPETSRQTVYFYPTILAIGFFVLLFLALFSVHIRSFFIISLICFYLLAVFSVFKKGHIILAPLAGVGIILTHLTYGIYFMKGLLSKNLIH